MRDETRCSCSVCNRIPSSEELACSWPIAALDGKLVCPDCYGDEAYCRECGHLLNAIDESPVCPNCEACEHCDERLDPVTGHCPNGWHTLED